MRKTEQDFQASEEYWHNKATLFSNLYQTKNPTLIAGRLFLQQRQEIILNYIKDDSANCVLDVGCGSGEFLELIVSRYKKGIGIDYSDEMLRLAKERIKEPNVVFFKSDCAQMSLEKSSIDRIFALGLLDYVKELKKTLQEFHRVLSPTGFAVITVPKTPSLFEPLRWSAAFRSFLFKLPPVVNILTEKEFREILSVCDFEVSDLRSLWTTMWIAKIVKKRA